MVIDKQSYKLALALGKVLNTYLEETWSRPQYTAAMSLQRILGAGWDYGVDIGGIGIVETVEGKTEPTLLTLTCLVRAVALGTTAIPFVSDQCEQHIVRFASELTNEQYLAAVALATCSLKSRTLSATQRIATVPDEPFNEALNTIRLIEGR
eukprot:6228613-Prymnesium_polylepis.2